MDNIVTYLHVVEQLVHQQSATVSELQLPFLQSFRIITQGLPLSIIYYSNWLQCNEVYFAIHSLKNYIINNINQSTCERQPQNLT